MAGEPKILVIDDEEEICLITKSLLGKRNYACFTARTAADGLREAEKERPDLVLLDVRLGEQSGIDVLRKLKQLDKDIRVIMVTGLGDEDTVREALNIGADDYLVKPFSADFLSQALEQNLAKREGKNG